MHHRSRAWLAFLALRVTVCLLYPGFASAVVPTPQIGEPITDLAGVLPTETKEYLDRQLRAHVEAGHAQIAVVLISTLGGEPIDDFAIRTASAWQGGSREKDDGVLWVLAIDDRLMRVEVGYGLEACIPDSTAAQLLNSAKPRLKEANYADAVDSVVTALIGITERCSVEQRVTSKPPSLVAPRRPKTKVPRAAWFILALLLGSAPGRGLAWWAKLREAQRTDDERLRSPIDRAVVAVGVGWVAFIGTAFGALGLGWTQYLPAASGVFLGFHFMWRLNTAVASLVFIVLTCLLSWLTLTGIGGAGAIILVTAGVTLIGYFIGSMALSDNTSASWAGSSSGSSSSSASSSFWTASSSTSTWDPPSFSSSSTFGSSSSGSASTPSSYSGGGGSFGGGGASSSW